MRHLLRALAPAAILALTVTPAGAQQRAFRFSSLLDGNGQITPDAVVVVEGDRIVSVGSGARAIPSGADVVDLRPLVAIPGMIDAHTHITYYWDQKPGTQPWSQNGRRRMAETVFLAQENARRTLQTGVTTVRDLGSREYGDLSMRDLIARGAIVGPRIFGAGYGLQKLRQAPAPGTPVATARGRVWDISEIPAAVKAQVDAGADIIKMYGSTGSGNDVSGEETFTFEEMKAAVDAAHALGKSIAIHSYGPEGGHDAIRAGANSLEHAVDLSDDDLSEMVRRGTTYVPTVDHNRYYADHLDDFGYSAEDKRNLDAFRARNLETARRAFRAGVPMAMGSDAVFTGNGENTGELVWFVEIGMTPAEALATATVNAAVLIGQSDRLGRVASGFLADIVGVEGDPASDIHAVTDGVQWVMKGGQVVVDRRAR